MGSKEDGNNFLKKRRERGKMTIMGIGLKQTLGRSKT
jgi:hypothetical protein